MLKRKLKFDLDLALDVGIACTIVPL